jgi:hypothetical protein
MDGTSKPFPYLTGPGCSKDGWCWSTPTPQGNTLYSVSGSSASDVWAVGDAGAIVHWDGQSWAQVPSGVQSTLNAVWAAGAADAWAVGEASTTLRWNGIAWSALAGVPVPGAGIDPTMGSWKAVWGTGPSNVWIVGSAPPESGEPAVAVAMHWDGSQWTTGFLPTHELETVWGTGLNDVWAVDASQVLYHFDGQGWTTVLEIRLGCPRTTIWGTSSSDFWLGSECSAPPSHWDGMNLDLSGGTTGLIDGLWGSRDDDVWAVGDISAASALTPDPYADAGLILHWNGLSWDQMPSTGAGPLFGVWGSRSDDVWAVGRGGDIVHWDGRAWSAPAGPPHLGLYSNWGGGPDDVWAFGLDELGLAALHWNGQTWAKTEILDAASLVDSNGLGTVPLAPWGSSSDDIWIATAGPPQHFVHWDGHSWALLETSREGWDTAAQTNAMWGNGPNDVWAVGYINASLTGVAIHWDGTYWSAVRSLSPIDLTHPFYSVWSSGPDDVWIGADTVVLHWDGTAWSQALTGPNESNYAIGGSGPSDVWAVARRNVNMAATASHWDGTSWHQLTAPGFESSVSVDVTFPTVSVVATSPTNAWFHDDSTVVHWDGTALTLSDPGTNLLPGVKSPGPSNFYWDGTQVWTIAVEGVIRHP